MTCEELENLISLGEDSLLELKHVSVHGSRVESPDSKSIADELSAFANSHFGRIVFGVDDGTLCLEPMSVAELNVVETWVRNICNDIVEPQLACKILKIPVSEGVGVLVVEVPRSVFVHKGGHGYFTRIGSSKRELSPEMLARLRNELIYSVLSRCKLTDSIHGVGRLTIMDRRGEGVPIIFEEGEKCADKKPKYELIGDDELVLTLYSALGDSPADLYRIAKNYTDKCTDKTAKVLDILQREPHATQAHLVKNCGVSRSTIAKILASLKREGRIVREGSDRQGVWRVPRPSS